MHLAAGDPPGVIDLRFGVLL